MRMSALFLTVLLSACSPVWWQGFKENPAQNAEMILGTVSIIERVATLAFTQLEPMLPLDKQAVYQAKFDESVLTLSKAMQAVRSAVRAAANAKEEHPDLTKVMIDVTTAVKDVQALVAEVRNLVAPAKLGVTAGGVVAQAPKGVATTVVLDTFVEDLKQQTGQQDD